MIIPFTLLIGAVGYLCYKSKDDVSLIDKDQLDSVEQENEKDDLYSNLEDLFI